MGSCGVEEGVGEGVQQVQKWAYPFPAESVTTQPAAQIQTQRRGIPF